MTGFELIHIRVRIEKTNGLWLTALLMIKKVLVKIILTAILCAAAVSVQAQPAQVAEPDAAIPWQRLADGLELGTFRAALISETGDSMITILRIDPARYRFRLLNASATTKGELLSAKQWCRQYGLVAAINASMYQTDYKSSVSLMVRPGHINNPRLSKDMTVLAFDRLSSDVPPVKIIDRQCEDFRFWQKKYATLVQSIRMISCTGKNVWQQQPRKWSTAAIATDQDGRVLFVHVRSLYTTHDLINILQSLPVRIARAMYAEGGPQAQLYVQTGKHELEFNGSHLNQNNVKLLSWPIPNVIGISLRDQPTE